MSVGEEVLIRSRRRSVAVGLLDVGTRRCAGGRRFEPTFFGYETTQYATSVWHPVKRLEHSVQTIGQSNGFRWIVRGCPPEFGAIVRYECVNKGLRIMRPTDGSNARRILQGYANCASSVARSKRYSPIEIGSKCSVGDWVDSIACKRNHAACHVRNIWHRVSID